MLLLGAVGRAFTGRGTEHVTEEVDEETHRGVAALEVVAAANVASAQPSQAASCVNPHDASVSHGSYYKATFKHCGEVLIVEDHITDGLAAVAYVRVYRFMRCEGGEVPIWSNEPVDTDTFVMDHGYDNCSDWKNGFA